MKRKPYLRTKDYTLTGEEFDLIWNEKYDMLITNPKPNELNIYYESQDYISHTDSKRNLFEYLYHFVKQRTLKKKVGLINKLNNGVGNMLDIGAGTGDFLSVAQAKGWKVQGFEPSKEARNMAAKKNVVLSEKTDLVQSESLDVITMWHVLEHVENLEAQIKELQRMVKPKGHLIIAVPNFKSYDAAYYKSFWAAYDVPRHLWHFSKKSIQRIFENKGFELIQIKPMIFDAYYVAMLSEKYKKNSFWMFNGFFQGFISNLKAFTTKEYSSHIYILQKK